MRSIFISYRRDDTEGQAGRLFQDLRDAFGADAVFMDVTAIEPGADFRKVIEQNTASCGVLLSLIGRDWLAADAQGRRRIDDANDFVRLETASALRRDIPVIPVLLQGARMPRPDELPEELHDLAFRNALELRHASWDNDVQVLLKAVRPIVERGGAATPAPPPPLPPPPPTSQGRRWLVPAGLAAVVAVGAGVWGTRVPAPTPAPVAAPTPTPAAAPAPTASPSPRPQTRPAQRPTPTPSPSPAPVPTSAPPPPSPEPTPVPSPVPSPPPAMSAADREQVRAHNEGYCVTGFVWREARVGDKVCVTPQIRSRTATENRLADTTRQPGGGAYGPNTCRGGFVWREAYPGDVVCVAPDSRRQAAADNAAARSRIVPLPLSARRAMLRATP